MAEETDPKPKKQQLCPVCNMPMLWYKNPGRWVCKWISLHQDPNIGKEGRHK
jgi:hypothetical protein